MRRVALFLCMLAAALAQAPDPAQVLGERLESATSEERARLLAQEGPTETLRAAYKSLGNRSLTYSPRLEFDKAILASKVLLDIADTFKDPGMKVNPLTVIAQAMKSQGKYIESLEMFRTALPLSVASGNKRQQGILHGEIGDTQRLFGEMEQSKIEEDLAMQLFEEIGDKPAIARTLLNLGNTVKNTGQVQVALEYFTKALHEAEAAKSSNMEVSALLAIASLYTSQHDYAVALSYVERIKTGGLEMADKRRTALVDGRIGNLYLRLGRPDAREVLERALREDRELNDFLEEAWILQRLAELDEDTQPQLALQRYEEAAELYRRAGDLVQESSSLAFLARLHSRLHEPGPAALAAEKSLEAARKMGAPKFIGGALDELGKAYRELGRTREAEAAFRESIQWTEGQRLEIVGGEANGANFLTGGRASPYTALMDLRAEQGDVLEAIQLSEKVRGRRLLDAMAQGKVDPQQSLTTQEKVRELELSREAARWNLELSRANPGKETKAAFEKAARDLEAYRLDLYSTHPHLRTKRGEVQALTPAAIQSLVPDAKALLIEYAFSEKGAWIFTVARGDSGSPVVKAKRLEITPDALAVRVEEFRKSLATRDLSYASLARSLYRDLLGPVEDDLKGRTIMGILPDGPLWNLPFQALLASDGQFLIQHAALYYGPSLAALYEASPDHRQTTDNLKPLLALGAGAGELPYAAAEVRALSSLYGPLAVALSGTAATEQRWKQDAEGYRVLHVAAHGILNSTNPLFSYLQLSKSGGEDGMLEAREILDLNLRAELVVLSACETGRGELIGGEGVFGMSWAVLTAGTSTVVVSQWKVDSASTTQLMVAFHRTIAPEAARPGPIRGKAEALRRAELELIHTPGYQHPFYWAGFEMLGDGN